MTRTARSLTFGTVPVLAVAALLLTGCSGGSGSASAAGRTTGGAAASSGSARAGRPTDFGVAGPIASVSSGSFTVTATSGGVTVDYGTTTVFDRTATGTLADVHAGSCVVVGEAAGSDATTGSVDASSVRISPPVKGSCTDASGVGGRGGFGGFGGFGGSGARPSGGRARPSGGFPGGSGNRGGGVLLGSVASVSGSGFVVTVQSAGGTTTPAAGSTTAVVVSSSTNYTVTTTASAKDLSVGQCARVFPAGLRAGASGSAARPTSAPTGPVTAGSVTLSAPVNGSCSAGTPFRGGRSSGSTGAGA